MKQLGHLKTYKMKLTTLSPIFIGGGEKLSNLDFIFNPMNGKLNLIHEAKFSKFLLKNNLLDAFTNYISDNKFAKLFDWFKRNGLNADNIDIFKRVYNFPKSDLKALNDINLFVKNTNDMPYIPASSIKGVIRTAILQKKLNENPYIKEKYKSLVELALNEKQVRDLEKIKKDIEKDLICIDYKKILEKENINTKAFKYQQETADVFRGIQVSDSQEIENKNLNLYKKVDYSLGDDKVHSLPLYRECIEPYVPTYFTISLDTKITDLIGIDIEYIIQALDEYSNTWHNLIKDFEKDADRFNLYFPKEEEDYNANFCIGGGAGFLTKTIIYTLFENKTSAINAIKKYLDLSFMTKNKQTFKREPAHKHVARDTKISPRTLKLALDNGEYVNLGWCNIAIAE